MPTTEDTKEKIKTVLRSSYQPKEPVPHKNTEFVFEKIATRIVALIAVSPLLVFTPFLIAPVLAMLISSSIKNSGVDFGDLDYLIKKLKEIIKK